MTRPMYIGVVVSDATAARPAHTTVHLCAAALARGHTVTVHEPADFLLGDGALAAHGLDLTGASDRDEVVRRLHTPSDPRTVDVCSFDLLLLRANPYNDAVVTFGALAQSMGVRVLSDPRGLVATAHKAWLATLAGVPQPRTLVAGLPSAVLPFARTCPAGVVVKPSRSGGGRGVVRLEAPEVEAGVIAAFMLASQQSVDGYVIVQEYLPEAVEGEKRLLWHAGALLGGYRRERPPGDFRHNLKLGATPHPCDITAEDVALAAAIGPHLTRAGVWFAGLDVIGGRLVEVNTLNPGGAHYAGLFGGRDLADVLIASLETRD